MVQATAALAAVTAFDASVSVGYNPDRPWQQKWRDVQNGLSGIEQVYAAADINDEVIRRQVEDFFKGCREMADWVKEQAGKPEAMAYVNSDPDLVICDGMAQTVKHHTRRPQRDPDPLTARVARVHGGGGVRVEIDWSRPSGASGTEDALDLARRCVAAWESFFQQNNLDPAT